MPTETTLPENESMLDGDDAGTEFGDDDEWREDEHADLQAASEAEDEEDGDEDNAADGDESRFFTTRDDSEDYKHWRDAKWNPETKMFDLVENERDAVDDEVPKVHQWLRVPPRDMKKVYVTFNGGRETIMSNFIQEYKALHDKLDSMEVERSEDGLFEYLFGEDKPLANCLVRILKISYKEACQFLATVFFAAELGIPAFRLENHPSIDYKGFMEQSRFNEIWNAIANAGKNGESDKLWEELEGSLNKVCRELFLSEGYRSKTLRIALDDDKVHLHYNTSKVREDSNYLVGMKPCQHVEANCRGFTIDSAVLSATGFPLQFSVLRAGESNTDSYKRMIKSMFNHSFSKEDALHMALWGVVFCSDRGYWNAALILVLLGWGATVFGTLKQSYWVPYTYDQKDTRGRETISTKHGRSCFQAFCRFGSYMLKVMAWRSGTGAVSLAMNSRVHSNREPQTFDFCFKKNGDAVWYKSSRISQDSRNLKAIPAGEVITEKHPESLLEKIDSHLEQLARDKVTMLTVSTLDHIWFVLRMFSLTSSSVHSALRYSAPLIDTNDQAYSSFGDVLSYAGLSSTLRTSNEEDDNEENDTEENDNNDDDVMTAAFIKATMKSLLETDTIDDGDSLEHCVEGVERMGREIQQDVPASKLILMFRALGIFQERSEQLAQSNTTKALREWIKSIKQFYSRYEKDPSTKYKFPYEKILVAKEVEAELRDRVGVEALTSGSALLQPPNPKTKADRIKALEYLDEHHPHLRTSCESDDSNEQHSNLFFAIINGTVSRAFLRPNEGSEKKEARLGHQNETPYLQQYYKDSREGHVPNVRLVDVRKCGLAMKNGRSYVRDSADAIAFEETDLDELVDEEVDDFDPIQSHPVECKCRSGRGFDGSLSQAESIQKKIVELGGLEYGRRAQRGAVFEKS